MKNFVLVFPFLQSDLALNEGTFYMPGCPISLTGKKQSAVADLENIFLEHASLDDDAFEALKKHQTLYFLQGEFKSPEEFDSINKVIISFLESGALGVYMEHSGAAWSQASFLEWAEQGDLMSAWLNFIETSDDLYTLGMEVFGRPDLCIRLHHGEKNELQDTLADIAESLFLDESIFDTGSFVELESSTIRYELRKELNQPYSKDSLEYNRKGVWRLVPKK